MKAATDLSPRLLEMLRGRGLTVSSAESCTGGNIARSITAIAGSSDVFKGAVVAYSNDVKHRLLHVRQETLDAFGAVSEQTVTEMLCGVMAATGSNCAMATSGIAGPDGGTPLKPVGTVCIGAACGNRSAVSTFHFSGNRAEIIEQSTIQAIQMLMTMLEQV